MSRLNVKKIRIRFGAIAGLLLTSSLAHSSQLTTLKQVQVTHGSQIDLLFDGKVDLSQVKTEFFNDIIQISMTDAAVYPAKISSVNGASFIKIFAYQYAPKLVRCRLSVKGKAEDFKNRFQVSANGKIMTLRVGDSPLAAAPGNIERKMHSEKARPDNVRTITSDRVETASAQALHAKTPFAASNASQNAEAAKENALLARIMKGKIAQPDAAQQDLKQPEHHQDVSAAIEPKAERQAAALPILQEARNPSHGEKQHLAGGKPLPSPMGIIVKLAGVIALFGALAFLTKRFVSARNGWEKKIGARIAQEIGPGASAKRTKATLPVGDFVKSESWLSGLGELVRSAGITKGGRREKMIEVLSNHYLGPKKSISVVKVMGRTLVLGVTNDSINLISEISSDGDPLGAVSIADEEHDDSALESFFKRDLAPRPSSAKAYAQAARTMGTGAVADPDFTKILNAEAQRPQGFDRSSASVRNQIRSRLEGLKPL